MHLFSQIPRADIRLTVTKVVFELPAVPVLVPELARLTVTKVVFESKILKPAALAISRLTVTKVVFESNPLPPIGGDFA